MAEGFPVWFFFCLVILYPPRSATFAQTDHPRGRGEGSKVNIVNDEALSSRRNRKPNFPFLPWRRNARKRTARGEVVVVSYA